MRKQFIHAKIHRCRVTRADLNYVGSVSIDKDILDAVGILEHQKVLLVNLRDGARMETYTLAAPSGSKEVGMNGGSAHLFHVGDIALVLAWCDMEPGESVTTKVAIMDESNNITQLLEQETSYPA